VCTRLNTLIPSSTWTYFSSPGFNGSCLRSSDGLYYNVLAIEVCPTGYTKNTVPNPDTCTATSAVPKPSDGTCTIVRVDNSFSADTNDPDCAVTPNVSITPSSISITPNVGPSATVGVKSDSTTTITVTTVNNTTVTTTTDTVSGGVPDVTSGDVAVVGKSSKTYSGTGTGADPLAQGEFPTDYNRESTQTAVKGVLDTIAAGQCGGAGQPACKLDETATPTDSSLATEKASFDTAAADRVTALENLAGAGKVTDLGLGLTIEWPSVGCTDPSFAMPHGFGDLVVPMCSRQGDVQAMLGWLFAVGAAITIFGIATGAVGSGGKR
jgi:hypothetical protein